QLLSTNPSFVTDNSTGSIVITADLAKGNGAITNFNDVVIHTGVITSKSTTNTDWKYSKFPWPGNTSTNTAAKCTPVPGTTKVTFTITNGLRNFYGITDATEKILKIALLFRNAAGTVVQRNFDGSDMYIPVYESALAVRIDQPFSHPTFNPLPEAINITVGQPLAITANSNVAATLKLFLNGNQVGTTVNNGTTISANPTLAAAGNQEIVAEAVAGGVTKRDTMKFVIAAANNVAPIPAGLRDGINYDPADPTSATLVFFAPQKQNVFVIGDFTNWERKAEYQMNVTPDNNRYWLKITGLTPGVEYAYQFVIDGSLTVADYFTEKVLDPWNDKWIPATTYPNLKPYPEGKTSGIVSILQTSKPAYNWKITNFQRPTQHNLIAYEMHMRDFLHTQSYKSLLDTLDYIKNLGMNCVKFMPINEFEGNNSWGYNPNFYFAVDKAYGTEHDFKRIIDACHEKGMAVVIDMVLNHSFGSSPMVQMYWNAAAQKPAANSPWFFPDARHPFNVGFDMNHDLSNQATKDFVDRVMEHWLVNFKVDGFRWDLSKGFTPLSMNTADIGVWNAFSQARIDIWKRIYDKMQQIAPGTYCILEHLGDNGEEAQLGNHGMMLWGKMTDEYNNATMGFPNNGDLTRSFDRPFWNKRNLVSYMESHDEER
ncbi:MAG: alpha-amylase family glycosyl hydrolase, partial [Chitinophagaceae bacterium]